MAVGQFLAQMARSASHDRKVKVDCEVTYYKTCSAKLCSFCFSKYFVKSKVTSSASIIVRRRPLYATVDFTSFESSTSSEPCPADIALGPAVAGTEISCELTGGVS